MTAPLPAVDVVVPVLNGGSRFRECLVGLFAQEGVDARVIVVDNGSNDGSAELAAQAGALVVGEKRRSSYAARNRGIAESTAPVIAFTDADTVPRRDWLVNALRSMAEHGWDLCAGAIVHDPPTGRRGSYDALTYLDQEESVGGGLRFAATANLFVSRRVFDEVGPFDASLRSGGDLEFCRRATAAGRSLGFEGTAVVSHAPREQLRAILAKAWRLGVGHAEVGLRDPLVLRWGLSPKRLLPDRRVLVRHWSHPCVIVIAAVAGWTSWAARMFTTVGRWRAVRRGSP